MRHSWRATFAVALIGWAGAVGAAELAGAAEPPAVVQPGGETTPTGETTPSTETTPTAEIEPNPEIEPIPETKLVAETEPIRETEPIAETEVTIRNKVHASAGAGFTGPLGGTVFGEMILGLRADVRDDGARVSGLAGLVVQAHAGTGGAKLSLGAGVRARIDEEDFRGGITVGCLVSLARTRRSPIGTEPGLTYLGPELELSVKHVAVTLGTLWRIDGSVGKSVMLSWGIGLRL
jgi:hypothetical protein